MTLATTTKRCDSCNAQVSTDLTYCVDCAIGDGENMTMTTYERRLRAENAHLGPELVEEIVASMMDVADELGCY